MKIEIHDGFNSIGGNKISVCSRSGECFLLDFGINFSKWGEFFEEFLNPRTGRIVEDLLKLEIVPRIPVYRKDFPPADLHWDGRYRFVFMSHAHADHIGMVGLLSGNIPLVMTPETFSIALTDSWVGAPKIWGSIASSERVDPRDVLVRKDLRESPRGRGARPLERRVFIVDGENVNLPEGFKSVKACDIWDEFRVLRVYHSVIGASAIAVKVDEWWLVYTGDFRMGPKGKEKEYWLGSLGKERLSLAESTERFVESVKDLHPMVLIVEGTRVTRKEKERETTERDVYESALGVVSSHRGLVLVDFPVRHVERLFTFLKIAQETGRYLVLMPKDFAYLSAIEEIGWRVPHDRLRVYHPGKLRYVRKEREAMERAIEGGMIVEPEDVTSSPDSFIMACGYFDMKEILDFPRELLRDTIYIHSTSEAYTEEQEIDVKRFRNWLEFFSIEPYGVNFSRDEIRFTGEFHASGHVSSSDLEKLIDELEPEVIVPVHTLDKGWFEKRWKSRVRTEKTLEI